MQIRIEYIFDAVFLIIALLLVYSALTFVPPYRFTTQGNTIIFLDMPDNLVFSYSPYTMICTTSINGQLTFFFPPNSLEKQIINRTDPFKKVC